MNKRDVRHKLEHEMRSFLGIAAYLIVFFSAFSTYQALILHEFNISELTLTYGVAAVKGLVLAKIILIGDYAHLGTRYDDRPLIFSTLYKALAFGLLVGVFTFLEEVVKGLFHKETVSATLQTLLTSPRREEVLSRTVVMFCALIPFFAVHEIGRVLGESKLFELFFQRHRVIESDLRRRTQSASD